MKNYTKLLEAKKEIGKATKNATNPHFKNKYVDINALIDTVEPILLSKGLILLQPIEDGYVYSRIVDIDSAEICESCMKLPEIQDPQKIGSAVTYYRRYTLQSLLSLQADDDDGNMASKPQPKAKPTLNDKGFSQALERIMNGEVEIVAKLKETFTLTPSQEIELNEVLNGN
jgi:hypothetical protein